MNNWINETFNVHNDVSLPIIISLVVFITGGIIQFFIIEISKYRKRIRLIKTFKMLNKEMIKHLSKKEKVAYKFYPTVSPINRAHWKLKHIPLSYLETYFQLDYQELYFSFQKKVTWINAREKKEEAYHRIWSELQKLKFFEEQKEKDIEKLVVSFKDVHFSYNETVVELKTFHDEIVFKIRKDPFFLNEIHLQTVKKYYFNIWKRFLEMEEKKRLHHFSSYNSLIRPLIQLAKNYRDHPLMEPLIPLVVNCELKYHGLENVLKLHQLVFKNHYIVYRSARKLITRADKII